MEKINIELINKMLYDFVNGNVYINNQSRINIFNYTDSLKKIISENMPYIYARKYKRKMTLDESIKKAHEFFEYLGQEYADYFDMRLIDGTMYFEKINDAIDQGNSTFSAAGIDENGKRFIRVVYEENFEDVYAIIHEVLHDTNLIVADPNELTSNEYYVYQNRDTFTELISILGTLIARKYFSNKKEKEYDIDAMYELYSLSLKCDQLDFAIKMVNLYIEKGFITKYDLVELMEGRDALACEAISGYLEDIIDEEDLLIYFNERYLTGYVLAFYILNKYDKPEEVLKELNEMITVNYIEDIFDYLDLDCCYDDDKMLIDLDDDSKKILSKTFKQQVKRMH